MATRKELEEIDRTVEETADNPQEAERLKKALHERLERKSGTKILENESDDELWENLPV